MGLYGGREENNVELNYHLLSYPNWLPEIFPYPHFSFFIPAQVRMTAPSRCTPGKNGTSFTVEMLLF